MTYHHTREGDIPPSVLDALDVLFLAGPEQPTSKVAKALSISAKTLQRDERDAKIFCRRKGKSHRLFVREDVEAYLREKYKCRSTSRRAKAASRRARTTISIRYYGANSPKMVIQP